MTPRAPWKSAHRIASTRRSRCRSEAAISFGLMSRITLRSLTRRDLEDIRRIVREELERVLLERATSIATINADEITSTREREPDPAWWLAALANEPDKRKRDNMDRARSYLLHEGPMKARARRFFELSMDAELADEQVLAFARHHAETIVRARAKNLATRAAKRAAREKRDG